MNFNRKHLLFIIFLFNVFYTSIAQEAKAINNKGTIITVRNNTVTTSNTAPTNPLEGDVWIDNTQPENLIKYIKNATKWNVIELNENKTIVLNTHSSKKLDTDVNSYFNIPLTSSDIQKTNTNYYTVSGNSINILKDGNYLISSEISINNMPKGDTKYVLAVFLNSVRIGYLSRGYVSLTSSSNYWGTTGTLMYKLTAGDSLNIKYVLGTSGTSTNSDFLNIGITKI